MEKFRNRNFCLVLYPNEDESHRNAIDKIKKSYDYALINHDSDLKDYETGELKKEHTHVVLHFTNAIWSTKLAKDLGILENYIEECRDLKRALAYLIHYYDNDKYQYDIKNVHGTLKKKLEIVLRNDDKTESEKIIEILNYIDAFEYEILMSDFIRYCAEVGYWDVFRRSYNALYTYIQEHNRKLT